LCAGTTLGAQAAGRPDLEPVRIGGELIVSAYAAIGGDLAGRYIGGRLGAMLPHAAESTREQIAYGTGLVVGSFATAGGVLAIGSIGNQTGSYRDALIGAGVGFGTGLALRWLLFGSPHARSDGETSRMRWMGAAVESILPAIGATIAFNSSRRYR
jgi:hypothetical protein